MIFIKVLKILPLLLPTSLVATLKYFPWKDHEIKNLRYILTFKLKKYFYNLKKYFISFLWFSYLYIFLRKKYNLY